MSLVFPQTRPQEYFQERYPIVHCAIGYVQGLGFPEDFGADPIGELRGYRDFFERHAAAVESAWRDYYIIWLMSHRASAFPRWHAVETRLRDAQQHENLADYLVPIESSSGTGPAVSNHYKSHVGWDQLDHVCAFILRLQMLRFDAEAKAAGSTMSTPTWTQSQTWGAAYVLADMLQWLHVVQQEHFLETGGTTLGDVAAELAAPGDAMVPLGPLHRETRWYQFWSR